MWNVNSNAVNPVGGHCPPAVESAGPVGWVERSETQLQPETKPPLGQQSHVDFFLDTCFAIDDESPVC